MAEDLIKSIEQLSRERGISPDIFYSAIEEALLTVADKYFDHNSSCSRQCVQTYQLHC